MDQFKNEENMIDAQTFLFGGEYGDTYNRQVIDGFRCLSNPDEYPSVFENFGSFKENVKCIIEQYCWDTKNRDDFSEEERERGRNGCMCIDITEADDQCQIFEIPSDEILLSFYNEFINKKTYRT